MDFNFADICSNSVIIPGSSFKDLIKCIGASNDRNLIDLPQVSSRRVILLIQTMWSRWNTLDICRPKGKRNIFVLFREICPIFKTSFVCFELMDRYLSSVGVRLAHPLTVSATDAHCNEFCLSPYMLSFFAEKSCNDQIKRINLTLNIINLWIRNSANPTPPSSMTSHCYELNLVLFHPWLTEFAFRPATLAIIPNSRRSLGCLDHLFRYCYRRIRSVL